MTDADHPYSRTACTRRNLIDCDECGEIIAGPEQIKRTIRWGFWDEERQNYEKNSHEEHYCRSCWHEKFERDAAAYYEVTDPERFWRILEAADGDLVADLRPVFVGGRPWIRVVDGELQEMHTTVEADRANNILRFDVEKGNVDREWFFRTFRDISELPDDVPQIALLKPADETPFGYWNELPEDQTTLDEVEQ